MSPGLVGHGAELRVNELVVAAEGFLEDVATRVSTGFAFVYLSVAQEPVNVRVVLAELFDFAGPCWQIIDAAVADVREIHPARREPAQAQGRFHPGAFVVTVPHVGQRLVDFIEKLCEHVVDPGRQSGGGELERAGK